MSELDLSTAPPELIDALVRKTTAEADAAEYKAYEASIEKQNYEASNDANRVLLLSGPIVDTEQAIAILNRWRRRDPGKDVTIYINTPGGSIFDGNALVSAIRDIQREGGKVTIKGHGTVMSYGAVLLQAADIRVLDKDVVFMIHSLNAPIMGSLEQIVDQTKMLNEVQDRLLSALVEKSKISKTKLKQMTRRKEWFLSATEALKFGFCDKVE